MSAFAPLVGANSLADSGRDGVVSDTLVDEILLRDGQLAVVIATVIAALDRYATQPGISRAQLVGAPRHLASRDRPSCSRRPASMACRANSRPALRQASWAALISAASVGSLLPPLAMAMDSESTLMAAP